MAWPASVQGLFVKGVLAILCLCSDALTMSAQGLVNFNSTANTLLTVRSNGSSSTVTPIPAGSIYIGLLIAPQGTTDPRQFTFSGVYATNSGGGGRFTGGNGVSVPGWGPGVIKSFLCAAWDASLGHDWEQSWITNAPAGFWGVSSIGSGVAGGGLSSLPPLPLFGGAGGIQSGWTVVTVSARLSVTLLKGLPITTGQGLAFQTYTIQASHDLSEWTDIGIATTDVSGAFTFQDARTAAPQRFYRVMSP